jgi:hypothetical protein
MECKEAFDAGEREERGIGSMRKIIIKLSSWAQTSKDPTAVVAASTSPTRPVQVGHGCDVILKTHPPVPSLGMYSHESTKNKSLQFLYSYSL